MKESKATESQIMNILKQAESGVPIPDLYRDQGVSTASFYKGEPNTEVCKLP